MPQAKGVFTIEAPVREVWRFVGDIAQLAACIPGTEDVEIKDEVLSYWKIKADLGIFSRVVEVEARLAQKEEPSLVQYVLQGISEKFTGSIHLDLAPISQGETQASLTMILKAGGPMGSLINYHLDSQMEERVKQFTECVERRFK